MGKSKDLATGNSAFYQDQTESDARYVNTAGDIMTGNLDVGNSTNISMDASSSGQLRINGNGYDGAIALDGTGMNVYHNSSLRNLSLGTNETARLKIDGSGRVTMPNQPSFTAHRQTDQDRTESSTNVGLVFNSVDHNIGNHYSTSTGRFTCPVDGVYFISFSIRLDFLGGSYAWCYPYVNGSSRYDTGGPNFITQDTGSYTTLAAAGQLSLSANDYVQIYAYVAADSDWDFENASNFSMRLMG